MVSSPSPQNLKFLKRAHLSCPGGLHTLLIAKIASHITPNLMDKHQSFVLGAVFEPVSQVTCTDMLRSPSSVWPSV
jgi:hypothetical protein